MITFAVTIGLVLVAAIVIGLSPNSNSPSITPDPIPPTPQSIPEIENFKHDARRIGGTAFPAPKIEQAKIAREPADRSSTYLNPAPKPKDNQPTFLMHRPLIENITTITSDNRTITLAGIAPLPIDTSCKLNGKTRPCGRLARTALRALIRGRTLKCDKISQLTNKNLTTTSCKIGKIDLANWLIKQGWTTSLERSQAQTK